MSIVVPTQDLAPSLSSRIVRIKVADMLEGPLAVDEERSITFTLPGDLRVPADDVIIRAGARTVVLDANGEGQIRLPTHDPDAIAEGLGADWYLLESRSWSAESRVIRVPVGDTSISLADIPSVVEVTPQMGQWLLTSAGAEIVEGPAWAVTVTTSGGVARFRFVVPPGGTAWAKAGIAAGGEIDSLRGQTAIGHYRIDATSVTGLPKAALGTLDVYYNSASARTTQIFTDMAPGELTQTIRVFSSGAWTAWTSLTWGRGVLASTVDLNTVRMPGAYAVQFLNHANVPVAKTGTLEVFRMAGADVLQRYTSRENPPRKFSRIGYASTWDAWVDEGSSGGGGAALESVSARVTTLEQLDRVGTPRAPLTAKAAAMVAKPAASIMSSISRDRVRGWNAYTSSLSTTLDDGATWTQVTNTDGTNPFAGTTVESVRELGNGELLVTAFRGSSNRREVWVSAGYPAGTPTFALTMTSRATGIKFTTAWSQSDHGRLVLINEYGPKMGQPWDGQTVYSGLNARYTYLSLDFGRTWRTVFDLNTFLTGQMGRATADAQHLHGVAWDPYWDRIWVTYGDNFGGTGSNGVAYSDDLGATWHSAHHYSGTSAPNQVVGIIALPRCILFGGDNGSPDVLRIDRTEGKRTGIYPMPVAFDSAASGNHLCQAIYRAHRPGDDAPAFLGFSAEGMAAPSFVVATFDGYTFSEVWRDSIDQSAGMGMRNIVGPTLRGEMIFASNDQRVAGSWSEVRMKAPGY